MMALEGAGHLPELTPAAKCVEILKRGASGQHERQHASADKVDDGAKEAEPHVGELDGGVHGANSAQHRAAGAEQRREEEKGRARAVFGSTSSPAETNHIQQAQWPRPPSAEP